MVHVVKMSRESLARAAEASRNNARMLPDDLRRLAGVVEAAIIYQ